MNYRNRQPDLIAITSYPKPGATHGTGTVGVASYAKNTLKAIQKTAAKRLGRFHIAVIAEKLSSQPEQYKEHGIDIKRVWERGNPLWIFQILRAILPYYNTQKILIEFELAMLGNPIQLALFPILLIVLRMLGKDITIVMHQVISDMNHIAPHINMDRDSVHTKIMNIGSYMFYTIVGLVAQKIIVFDNVLATNLSTYIHMDKIAVIPHGAEKMGTRIARRTTRATLGYKPNEFIILCFGFIAWYKGSDWIVKTISKMKSRIGGKSIRLVIAGGVNPNHEHKEYYSRFIADIQKIANHSKGKIVITGFVPEEQIRRYFTASDLVLFPYQYMMSASGPLSLALSFGKPFLISSALAAMTQTNDMATTMKAMGIHERDIQFRLTKISMEQTLQTVIKSKKYRLSLASFSRTLGHNRNFRYIGDTYYSELFIKPLTTQNTFSTWKQQATDTITATLGA